jgi:Protein of unknown function (DUF1428)
VLALTLVHSVWSLQIIPDYLWVEIWILLHERLLNRRDSVLGTIELDTIDPNREVTFSSLVTATHVLIVPISRPQAIDWFSSSKEVRDAAHKNVMADPRMQPDKNPMPFDGKRMIFGGFEVLVEQ